MRFVHGAYIPTIVHTNLPAARTTAAVKPTKRKFAWRCETITSNPYDIGVYPIMLLLVRNGLVLTPDNDYIIENSLITLRNYEFDPLDTISAWMLFY